jgi:hypothetical protein
MPSKAHYFLADVFGMERLNWPWLLTIPAKAVVVVVGMVPSGYPFVLKMEHMGMVMVQPHLAQLDWSWALSVVPNGQLAHIRWHVDLHGLIIHRA